MQLKVGGCMSDLRSEVNESVQQVSLLVQVNAGYSSTVGR